MLYLLATRAVTLCKEDPGSPALVIGNVVKRLVDWIIVTGLLIIPIVETSIICQKANDEYNGELLGFPDQTGWQRTLYPTMVYGYVEGIIAILLALYIIGTAYVLYLALMEHKLSAPVSIL